MGLSVGISFNPGGDLSGTRTSQTVQRLQGHNVTDTVPSLNQILQYGADGWDAVSLLGLELSALGGVAVNGATSGNTDVTLYTNSTGAPVLVSGIALRLSLALVGAGSVAMTVGLTAGAADFVTSQTINSATTLHTVYGWQSQLGARFSSGQDYNAILQNGESIILRLAASGTITTAPNLRARVFGSPL